MASSQIPRSGSGPFSFRCAPKGPICHHHSETLRAKWSHSPSQSPCLCSRPILHTRLLFIGNEIYLSINSLELEKEGSPDGLRQVKQSNNASPREQSRGQLLHVQASRRPVPPTVVFISPLLLLLPVRPRRDLCPLFASSSPSEIWDE